MAKIKTDKQKTGHRHQIQLRVEVSFHTPSTVVRPKTKKLYSDKVWLREGGGELPF